MESMTNEQIIEAVSDWQANDMLHDLTCGNDSDHAPLIPKEENGKVILVCSDCDYKQEHILEVVKQYNHKEWKEEWDYRHEEWLSQLK